MEWQPIATAPKDGTRIVLANAGAVDVGSWCDEVVPAKESGVEIECGLPEGWYGMTEFYPDDRCPTHWMPLPEPPK